MTTHKKHLDDLLVKDTVTDTFKFELHQIVKDKVTGFRGVILARSQYATGCRQYGVAPQKMTKEEKPPEWEWFDETRLQYTGKQIASLTELGGPSPRPPSKN